MSPSPKRSTSPEPAPDRIAQGPVAVEAIRPPRSRIWIVVVLLVAVVAIGAYGVRSRQASKQSLRMAVRTVKAIRGDLTRTLRLSGSVEAAVYYDVVAPRLRAPDTGRGMVLLYMPENGSMVKKGDLVAQIDGQDAEDHLIDVEAQVNQGKMEILRLKADQEALMETVRQRVRQRRGAWEQAQQDLRAAPGKNKIDQELLKLAEEEAHARYEAALKQVDIYQESNAAALRVAAIAQEERVRHRDRHQTDIAHLKIKTPIDGRVVLRPLYRHGEQYQVRIGDELYGGQMFMRVVDSSQMRLETSMNQAESELLRRGQRALIRFDAYPEIRLQGKIDSVGTIAASGRRVNYYVRRVPVRIAIEEHDPRVLPDLTASADVVLAEDPNAVIVPREAVIHEDGKPVVYVREADTFSAREVDLGLTSNTDVAIRSGVQPGDVVALEKPF